MLIYTCYAHALVTNTRQHNNCHNSIQILSLWTSAVSSDLVRSHSARSLVSLVWLSSSPLFSVMSRIDGLGPRRHCSLLGLALVNSLGPDSETIIAPVGAVSMIDMMHTIKMIRAYLSNSAFCSGFPMLDAASSTAGPNAAWNDHRVFAMRTMDQWTNTVCNIIYVFSLVNGLRLAHDSYWASGLGTVSKIIRSQNCVKFLFWGPIRMQLIPIHKIIFIPKIKNRFTRCRKHRVCATREPKIIKHV